LSFFYSADYGILANHPNIRDLLMHTKAFVFGFAKRTSAPGSGVSLTDDRIRRSLM
jgi:hypothetical protein